MRDDGPKPCGRCQRLPPKLEGAGRLYLWFPLGHSLGKLVSLLREGGWAHQLHPESACVVVRLAAGDAERLATDATGALTSEEARATRVLFKEGEAAPDLSDYARVGSLRQFSSMARAGWLVDLLAESRLTTHFQPIVHARDTSLLFAHEALMRGLEPDGALVPPGRMMQVAREADLLFQLDLAARLTAIREAVRHGLRTPLFINFTPSAIYDPAFCLRSTVAAINEAGLEPGQVVFEVIESDHAEDGSHLLSITDYYRKAGFQVALDDLGAGHSSLNLLHRLRPDIVKLDMELVRGIHLDAYKASITRKLLEIAQQLGIRTVAEGIETLEELHWVRAHGVDFVQGYLIGRPRSPPVHETPALLG